MSNRCPKCGKKFAVAMMVAGTIFGGCTCNPLEYVRHEHPPEVQIRWQIPEPPVAKVTSSSNMTITPGSGTLTLTTNTVITPGSASITFG